ncbi:MAG: cofactor-independent phosphoglycerate mutase [Candidatus Omnitrophota bacterium]
MKYIVLIGDGMADYPLAQLQGKTILEIAHIPCMNEIAKIGTLGRIKTVPEGFSSASDVANLTILGYEPAKYYCGRGPLEAANMGITLRDDEVAFRCNLITAGQDILQDYSAGHIASNEASPLIKALNADFGSDFIRFYPGISYRHLLVIKAGGLGFKGQGIPSTGELIKIKCTPPHDITGQKISSHLPSGKGAELLIELMQRSRNILSVQDINKVRVDLKENPGNMIWLWGQGKTPSMPSFREKYGVSGSMISAVDLLNGLARIIKLDVIKVPGATGYYDTNYEGKGSYGIESLKEKDFIFIHVEAPDEAGHNGDIMAKKLAVENFDKFIVKPALDYFKENPGNTKILVMPDHATPIEVRTHTRDPVFFAMCGAGIPRGEFSAFNETEAAKSKWFIQKGHELMENFIR